jgi:hypothetical protein
VNTEPPGLTETGRKRIGPEVRAGSVNHDALCPLIYIDVLRPLSETKGRPSHEWGTRI